MKGELPVLLCFHGGGTSDAIFRAQLRNVSATIREDFEMIYVLAPHEGPAGPGVLPLFADSGPFYWWFGGINSANRQGLKNTTAVNANMANLAKDLDRTITTALKAASRRKEDVAGVLGFSEGTLVSSLLLSQCSSSYERATGHRRVLPNLTFGVLICPGYRTDIAMTISQFPVRLPTIHLHGLSDPLLSSGRALLRAYKSSFDATSCLEFDGGHHIPTQKPVLKELGGMVGENYVKGMQLKMGMPAVMAGLKKEKSYGQPKAMGMQRAAAAA